MKTVKLKMTEAAMRPVQSARKKEGPARLRSFVAAVRKDAGTLIPPGCDPPEAVAEALAEFESSCDWAVRVADQADAAGKARAEAAAEDVKRAAAAMRDEKPAPKLTEPKADEAARSALVGLQAAEQLIAEAHTRLVDAVSESWAGWRRRMVTDAADAHAAAREAVSGAVEAVSAAAARYAGVGHLDAEMRSRFPDVKAATDAERRAGLPWYEETHLPSRRPLAKVLVPAKVGQINPAGNLPVELQDALRMVAEVVTADADWPAAAWVPPGDPDHERLLSEPVDLEASWVHGAVGRAQGGKCILCGTQTTERTKVVDDEGVLVLVHPSCLKRHDSDPKHKRLVERAEKEAKWRERQREQGGLSPRDERYGEAAAASAWAEDERDPEHERALNAAMFPGQ